MNSEVPSSFCLRLLPAELLQRLRVFPLRLDENNKTLELAMEDPNDFELVADLQAVTGLWIQPIACSAESILSRIEAYCTSTSGGSFRSQSDIQCPPVVKLVNELISEAMHGGVSDIHVEPGERELLVRFRKDGVLTIIRRLPARSSSEIISRIKIMSKIDIAERRRPQDGSIRFGDGTKEVDIRVSALPTEYGQKLVMRLLDKGQVIHDLSALGMTGEQIKIIEGEIHKPYGMFLITGPTGSGKTTTLYTILQMIRSPEINISTIEEPVEYKMDGIIQTAVNAKIGLTFASALRTLLRQDPDVIMVGEIRDTETAELAIRAALTGHLVFSTLHTNDAPSAVARLIDMGIEPFLVSSAVNMVMAQRLVRKVCAHCKGAEGATKGCMYCGGSGYRGRIGLFEMMPMSESIRELVHEGCSVSKIRSKALDDGMLTLAQDGAAKIAMGWTTQEEVAAEAMS